MIQVVMFIKKAGTVVDELTGKRDYEVGKTYAMSLSDALFLAGNKCGDVLSVQDTPPAGDDDDVEAARELLLALSADEVV